MNDTDFIKAMQQGLPPIPAPKPLAGLSVVDCSELLLGNSDIEINIHEAIHGICAEDESNDR